MAASVLQAGVGGITECDVILARCFGCGVIGFNVRANKQARERPSATASKSAITISSTMWWTT